MIEAAGQCHRLFGIDWIKIQARAKVWAGYGIVFALGGWFNSIINQDASLPYLHRSTSAYEQVTKTAGPNPVATLKCLRTSNAKAMAVAGQAVAAASGAGATVPNLAIVPKCPTPPPALRPSVSVRK